MMPYMLPPLPPNTPWWCGMLVVLGFPVGLLIGWLLDRRNK